MKLPPILTGIVLDPVAGTLDFSALGVGFDPRTVLGVLHEPSNRFVFAKGRPGLGYTAIVGSVMTLAADVSDLSAGPLTGFRDDGLLIATDARLEACRALIATGNATLSNLSTAIGTPSDVAPGSDAAAGSLIAKLTRALGYLNTLAATTIGGILQTAVRSNAPRVSTTAALGAANAAVTLAVDGMNSAVVQLSGVWAGTATFLGSVDGGANYFPVNMIPYGPGGGAAVGSATGNGQWEFACGGLTHVQVVMSAYTSGGATALLAAANGLKSVRVGNPAGNPLTVTGTLVENVSTVTTDASGAIPAGGTSAPLAANAARQFVEITNTGANPLAYRWGAAATAALGHILGPGQSARYDAKVPVGALNLFSTSGTTFFVTAG